VTVSLRALKTRAVLLDIEGTTTPVDFVYKTLFPYARAHAAEYLRREWENAECRAAVEQLRAERASQSGAVACAQAPHDSDALGDIGPADLVRYVYWLMDQDRKSPGLKALQGLIWREGYEAGTLRGEVYADVPPALERWRGGGAAIYIYSSGSVLAQRLLFRTTPDGDLTGFVEGYFDTTIGPKRMPDSYRAIADRIQTAADRMLFVSDVIEELDAAAAAGMPTVLCVRGEMPPPGHEGSHVAVRSFAEIGG
jgi:enolase-phosphatase E1